MSNESQARSDQQTGPRPCEGDNCPGQRASYSNCSSVKCKNSMHIFITNLPKHSFVILGFHNYPH